MVSKRRKGGPSKAEESGTAEAEAADMDFAADADTGETIVDLPWLQSAEDFETPRLRVSAWAVALPIAIVGVLAVLITLLVSNIPYASTEPVVNRDAAVPPAATAPAAPQGAVIQLASFVKEERALPYWKRLAERDRALASLEYRVVPASVGERTVYRLRASGPGSHAACERLMATGISCLRIGH